MKSFIRILFISLFLISGYSYAYCSPATSTLYKTLQFGNVIVQRDAPVGSVIASSTVSGTGQKIVNCTAGATYEYDQMLYLGGAATSFSRVYQTNIPGVGISGNFGSAGIDYSYLNPANSTYYSYPNPSYQSDTGQIFQLIKTGDIVSGTLSNGRVAKTSYDGYGDSIVISLANSSVTQVACSITTPNLIFPIGDVLASRFGSSVGTIPTGAQNTQNLGLNCDYGANINASLSGTQNPDVSTASVLALTGQGNADVAKGVGVQILYNGSPLVLNNRIVLKQSSGGQETFPLTARYYQTKPTVTTGTANASATLNLTYQ